MNRARVLDRLCEVGIMPVVRAESAAGLSRIARALAAGGVPITEVTMTVPGAIDGIRRLKAEMGDDVLLGVGSVTLPEQVEEAVEAGAEFVVSPVTAGAVVETAHTLDKAVIPGAFTPTEIHRAWEMGADVVKVFPASVGGPSYFGAVLAPMPWLKLMPTGGVSLETAGAFIRAGAVTLGVGSALVEKAAVASADWPRITERAKAFRDEIAKARSATA